MKQHAAEWPIDSISAAEVIEFGGAYFVSFIGEAGTRLQILKHNGYSKGFRSLDLLAQILRSVYGVKIFWVTVQLPALYPYKNRKTRWVAPSGFGYRKTLR